MARNLRPLDPPFPIPRQCSTSLTVDHIWWLLPTFSTKGFKYFVDDLLPISAFQAASTISWTLQLSKRFQSSLDVDIYNMNKNVYLCSMIFNPLSRNPGSAPGPIFFVKANTCTIILDAVNRSKHVQSHVTIISCDTKMGEAGALISVFLLYCTGLF